MKNIKNIIKSDQEALNNIMSIIGEAPVKEAPTYVYINGIAVEVDGKKTTTGPKRKCSKRASRNDEGRELLKNITKAALKSTSPYNTKLFEHSTEGLIVSLSDADYAIKINKSKDPKYNVHDEGFIMEKDFSTRGRGKNSSPGIVKAILAALEKEECDLCAAKASGITLQIRQGEYIIKISKKRDRVGFEAEKAAAYN